MKTTTVLAIALGIGALAACKQSPQENVADNIEANAENTADTIEANTSNASDNIQAAGENAADAVRNQGEQKADAVRNGADADGNSAKEELPFDPLARRRVGQRASLRGRPFRLG